MPESKALLHRLSQSIHRHGRGLLVCLVVALAVQFISEHYGGPALLYALMLGLALNFLGNDDRLRPGIDLCSRSVLRLGVALLGARISVSQVQSLGWPVAAFTVIAVILTVGFGVVLARCLRRHRDEGLISGCAVGICGASAALAAASVLPQTRENERFTMMALISVTLLSSMAMLGYPLIARLLDMAPAQAGIFFGAAIHDVAQVVAAGMLLSEAGNTAAADNATIVKLMRVLMLLPVVLVIALVVRRGQLPEQMALDEAPASQSIPFVPTFLLAFVVLMLLNSVALIPANWALMAAEASRFLLVMAIAAVALKTDLRSLASVGKTGVILMVSETAFLATLVLAAIQLRLL